MIQQDVQRGAYQTVDEYIEHAVSMLHEQEAWLAANRAEIEAQIDEGYASAQRGELLEPGEVRSWLNALRDGHAANRGSDRRKARTNS